MQQLALLGRRSSCAEIHRCSRSEECEGSLASSTAMEPTALPLIRVAVDRGGTFADVYATYADADPSLPPHELVVKLLSLDAAYPDAPTEGIRRILELVDGRSYPRGEILPAHRFASIRLSTTASTNALLERKGTSHALVVTKGFHDLLAIGNQSRPDIFALNIKRAEVLYSHVVSVDERVTLEGYTSDPAYRERAVQFDADGNVTRGYDGEDVVLGEIVRGMSGEAVRILKKVDLVQVRHDLQKLFDEGIRNLAVVLMHSFTYPNHEQEIGRLAIEMGFEFVSLSSASLPMIRIVARGQSTTADAYLTPVLRTYVDSFFAGFDPALRTSNKVEFMRSDGGLCDVEGFSGLKSLLSGPAGGYVGFAATAYEEGGQPVIGLDVGGTSSDVSRFSGDGYDETFETITAGIAIQSPTLNIKTVAAGGGSILHWANGLFRAGPKSAGSHPGPAAYRRGGPASVSDAQAVLGRLLPAYFPKIFGPTEDLPLDVEASRTVLEELRREINLETGKDYSLDEIAYGFVKVANETMVRPIRALTEAKGLDTSSHILGTSRSRFSNVRADLETAAFGGAGGQVACDIAFSLHISRVLIHRHSSILSAYGMALSSRVTEKQEPSAETFTAASSPGLDARLRVLEQLAKSRLVEQGFSDTSIKMERFLNMRYQGTDTAMMTVAVEGETFAETFKKQYREDYGFNMGDVPIIVDDIRCVRPSKT